MLKEYSRCICVLWVLYILACSHVLWCDCASQPAHNSFLRSQAMKCYTNWWSERKREVMCSSNLPKDSRPSIIQHH